MSTTYTEEQYEEMEEALRERDARIAAEVAALAAARIAQEDIDLAPLRTWLARPETQQIANELEALVIPMRDMPRVSPYAYNYLTNLNLAAGPLPQEPEEGDNDGE